MAVIQGRIITEPILKKIVMFCRKNITEITKVEVDSYTIINVYPYHGISRNQTMQIFPMLLLCFSSEKFFKGINETHPK